MRDFRQKADAEKRSTCVRGINFTATCTKFLRKDNVSVSKNGLRQVKYIETRESSKKDSIGDGRFARDVDKRADLSNSGYKFWQ